MPVTKERFDSGFTYQQYKEQMTRNRERFDEVEKQIKVTPEQVAAFKKLSKPLNVLVLAEDWCGDVIANVPILGKLADESGKLNVRVFLRDQNDDLTQQWLNKGEFKSIPVFVFFDENFNELGHFIERPDSVTNARAEKRKEIFAAHPEFGDPSAPPDKLPEDVRGQLTQALTTMRDELTPFANDEVVKSLSQIAAKAA